MTMASQAKAVIAVGMLFFLAEKACPQISILSKPVSGGGLMFSGSEYGGYERYERPYPGTSPDYSFAGTLQSPYSEYTGAISGGQGGISGWLKLALTPGVTNMKATSNASHAFDAFAEVVPGSKVKVKFIGNAAISWKGDTNDLWGNAGFSFDALNGEDKSGSLYRVSYPDSYELSPVINGSYSTVVQPPSVPALAENGKTYYKLGTFSLGGSNEVFSPVNEELQFSYSASVSGIAAYYVGNALTMVDGNNQTGLVDQALPKMLVVKVADGETGELAPGVRITFTLVEPSNGAKLGEGGTTVEDVTENGLAAVKLTLGSAAGNYTVKATCPAEVCTSGAKEVIFSATALSENEATELREVFCDGTYFAGQTLPYPLRVRAYNKVTGRPREGMLVIFSKVPLDKGALSATEVQTTGPNAIARTFLTLGPMASGITREQYTITATCADCLANTTVTCPVEAVPVPDKVNPQPDLELFREANGVGISILPNVVAPQGTGGATESQVTIQAAADTNFTATIYAVPFSGGHQHNADRPVGTWKEQLAAPQNVYQGRTDSAGKAVLAYVAGIVGGEERIEVVTADGKRGQKFVFVRIVGMTPLPRGTGYYRSGATDPHPVNHYGSAGLISNLTLLAEAFKSSTTLSGGGSLSVNDMSLISGGVFDTKENWVGDNLNTHLCHRRGTSVDLDRGAYNGQDILRIKNMARKINALLMANPQIDCRVVFEKKNSKGECKVHLECPGNPVTCASLQTDCEE